MLVLVGVLVSVFADVCVIEIPEENRFYEAFLHPSIHFVFRFDCFTIKQQLHRT